MCVGFKVDVLSDSSFSFLFFVLSFFFSSSSVFYYSYDAALCLLNHVLCQGVVLSTAVMNSMAWKIMCVGAVFVVEVVVVVVVVV